MSKKLARQWQIPASLGPCVCSQLRRTARKVSSFYDQALAGAGITITQHALLVNIARAGEIGRTSLAAQLGMDRTTLTRNLKPLENAQLVVSAASTDRRERLLCLSPQGNRKLRQSFTQWKQAQRDFASRIGSSKLKALRAALAAAESTAIGLL